MKKAAWDCLVPPYGRAQTAGRELIRIAGRVQHEFLDNGNIGAAESGSPCAVGSGLQPVKGKKQGRDRPKA